MATLTSPGVNVSVIDESFYVPSDAGTTPLIIVASGQDKKNGAGDGTASGTQTANANQAFLISSLREILTLAFLRRSASASFILS